MVTFSQRPPESSNEGFRTFKLWESFKKEDQDLFFGRDQESRQLYDKTFTSNLLLLYGASGSGKTSLIQCGLANKFEDSDWLPIYIRKGDNILKSLSVALREHTKDQNSLRNNSLREKIHLLFLEHFRPVFLIFDQFEELFIFGNKEEQISFFTLLPELLAANLQCKVIISIREDYLAYLDEFEDYIPDLFYNRMRLERMRKEQLEEVILGTCAEFAIQIGGNDLEEKQAVIDAIITQVESDFGRVDLVDLQVYLDQLYKKDRERKKKSKDADRPAIFDLALVQEVGNLEDVLGLVLAEEMVDLDVELAKRGAKRPGIPKSVLAELVTSEGDKHVMSVDELRHILQSKENINPEHVDFCIQSLLEIRILTDEHKGSKQLVEIAQDKLAKKIYSLIGGEKQKEKEIYQEIENAYEAYENRGALLDADDLAFIKPYLEKIVLTDEQHNLVQLSQQEVRKQGMRKWLGALGIIAILTLSLIFAIGKSIKFKNLSDANDLTSAALLARAYDHTKAYNLAQKALEIDESNQMANTVRNDMLIQSTDFPFYVDVLKGDTVGKFTDMDVSRDKKYLAAGSLDWKIIFYNLQDATDRGGLVIDAHEDMITDLDFTRSADGKEWLLTASKDGDVHLRQLINGQLDTVPRVFDHYGEPVYMADYVARKDDDDQLYTSTPKAVYQWTIKNGSSSSRTAFALIHTTSFEVIIRESETFILAASRDSIVRIIDVNNQEKIFPKIKVDQGVIENMDMIGLENDLLLAAGMENGEVFIMELDDKFFTGQYDPKVYESVDAFKAHEDAIKDLTLIKDEQGNIQILTSSRDKTAKLWEYRKDGRHLLLKTLRGHNDGLRAISHVRDGRRNIIFTGGEDRTIKKWVLKAYPFQELPGWPKGSLTASFTVDALGGKRVLIGHENKSQGLYRYDQTFSEDVARADIPPMKVDTWAFSQIAFSDKTNQLLIPIKADSGATRLKLISGTDEEEVDCGKQGKLLGIAYPSQVPTAVFLHDQQLRLWTPGEVTDSLNFDYPADRAVISPDGKKVVITAQGDEVIYYWHIEKGTLSTLADHTGEVLSVDFSPEGKYLLSGSRDNRFILYQESDDTLLRIASFSQHTDNVNCVAFYPMRDRQGALKFLTASDDGTLRLWKFKPSRTRNNIFVKLWKQSASQPQDVKEQATYINLGNPIVKGAFLTEQKIVTLDRQGTVKIWYDKFVFSQEFKDLIYPVEATYRDYLSEQQRQY